MTEKEQAWADISQPGAKCDACGMEVVDGPPCQIGELAKAGYLHLLCLSCCTAIRRDTVGRVVRLLDQIAKRSLP